MDKRYKTMSRVENFLSMMIASSNVSRQVFFGNLPAVIKKEWEDMILVDAQSMHDRDAFTIGTANIFLYAKSSDDNSSKPIKKLNGMEEVLGNAIDTFFNEHYDVEVNFRDQGYDAVCKYYYIIINVGVITK